MNVVNVAQSSKTVCTKYCRRLLEQSAIEYKEQLPSLQSSKALTPHISRLENGL